MKDQFYSADPESRTLRQSRRVPSHCGLGRFEEREYKSKTPETADLCTPLRQGPRSQATPPWAFADCHCLRSSQCMKCQARCRAWSEPRPSHHMAWMLISRIQSGPVWESVRPCAQRSAAFIDVLIPCCWRLEEDEARLVFVAFEPARRFGRAQARHVPCVLGELMSNHTRTGGILIAVYL